MALRPSSAYYMDITRKRDAESYTAKMLVFACYHLMISTLIFFFFKRLAVDGDFFCHVRHLSTHNTGRRLPCDMGLVLGSMVWVWVT